MLQISEAFRRFGISDGDSSVLVVLVGNQDEPLPLSEITCQVCGQQVPVDELSSFSDMNKIKKVCTLPSTLHCMILLILKTLHQIWTTLHLITSFVLQFYKITAQEENIGTLLDAVVCRMAIKDVL